MSKEAAVSGWSTVPPEVREVAERVCTPAQLEALKLVGEGYGYKRAARMLGVTTGAVRDRLNGAYLKIQRELEPQREGAAA